MTPDIASAVRVSAQGIAILTPAVEVTGPRILFVNDALFAMYRTTADAFIGQPLVALGIVERQHDIVNDLLNHIFEDDPFEAEVTEKIEPVPVRTKARISGDSAAASNSRCSSWQSSRSSALALPCASRRTRMRSLRLRSITPRIVYWPLPQHGCFLKEEP